MKIEFDTEINELKVDGMIVTPIRTNLAVDINYLDRLDGGKELLGHFLDLNIKFYKPI